MSYNLKPESFDVPSIGKIYITGCLSGLGLAETDPFPGDKKEKADVTNAQIFVQKVDGTFQFFVEGGAYALPTLGAAYNTSGTETNLFGPLPMAFIKIAATSSLTFEVGKLPTLIGDEYTFTFENFNIERGLLWNEEPAISRGIQAAYTVGPVTYSVSLNDGFYSNHYNWLSGSAAWTIDPSDTLTFVASGNLGSTNLSTFSTPLVQNNDSNLENLIYTYTSGAWTISPYVQYAGVNSHPSYGIYKSASQYGAALLLNYAVPNTSWNLSGRAEYISTSGSSTDGSPNQLFGAGSKAWTATITPSYVNGIFFTRLEASVVQASGITLGSGLGPVGNNKYQARFALESGILF